VIPAAVLAGLTLRAVRGPGGWAVDGDGDGLPVGGPMAGCEPDLPDESMGRVLGERAVDRPLSLPGQGLRGRDQADALGLPDAGLGGRTGENQRDRRPLRGGQEFVCPSPTLPPP